MSPILGVFMLLAQKSNELYIPHVEAAEYSTTSAMFELAIKYDVDVKKADAIIRCESNWNPDAEHHNVDGTLDHSYWQLNGYWWGDTLKKKGYDIHNPESNLEAGFYVLSVYGDKPWIASKRCWSKII